MPLRTPLYDSHLAAGAKMVDFSGWEMPINYGSQIEEHHAVRRDAGMFDVSHMCALDLVGPDATRWLRHLLANDVAKLTVPGKALYSCLLKEDGGVIDDLIVYFFTPEHFRIVVNAGTADKDIAWMRAQLTGFKATLTQRREGKDALAMIAVQGPNARERFWTAFPAMRGATVMLGVFQAAEVDGWLVARTGYTGEDGFEIALPAADAGPVWQKLLEAGVKPCGLGARDTLRLEAGMNLYGQDMDESISPYEAGLKWTVDLKDAARDFIGKSALEGANARQVRNQFAGLLLLDRGVLRAHQKVITPQGEGEITSGTFSPSLNQSIALARLPVGVALGSEVEVEIRDKRLKARVVKPSFVRNGTPLL
ncbi:glycine cleavage system aminomethyltransferase GcvT [Sulfuritalea hydrogenivorans]|uniref:Aminomethyltransferase n=1 Tax=Sulfuritalea hydrogenivorans sk43H TaxID=1223802 RepID=W0SD77_9PROT|nr:glycine cleavage system aminomethyltransferase GcvT [Sulfuritalea hydrogenivorans]BAO29006.1 glycine cleavage system aminomethyltransferase T [Sulfuritalea hydrogenivorans sk43H]